MGSKGRRLFGPQLGAASALRVGQRSHQPHLPFPGKEQESSPQSLSISCTLLLFICHLWGLPWPPHVAPRPRVITATLLSLLLLGLVPPDLECLCDSSPGCPSPIQFLAMVAYYGVSQTFPCPSLHPPKDRERLNI